MHASILPVSSLAPFVLEAPTDHDAAAAVLAIIEARMSEIYPDAFQRRVDGLFVPLGPETVGRADEFIPLDNPG